MNDKPGFTLRNCNRCKNQYQADNRNLNRGWGLCCSKKCAAKLREMSKPGYNPVTVEINNERRENWNDSNEDWNFDDMYGHFSNEDN